jgi:hypothetical protein
MAPQLHQPRQGHRKRFKTAELAVVVMQLQQLFPQHWCGPFALRGRRRSHGFRLSRLPSLDIPLQQPFS